MKVKVRDIILLAKALEREASAMSAGQREEMYENVAVLDLKEENIAEGRLVSTLNTQFGYSMMHNNRGKTKAQENIYLRVEIYDIDENRRPVVTRVEQETPQPAETPQKADEIPF